MTEERDWSQAVQKDIIIVGSGPAGCTAALYNARAGYAPLVLHGCEPGGQLTFTSEIENFPGFSGTGPELMEKMEEQATEAGAVFEYDEIVECDLKCDPKKLITASGTLYTCRALIIATGASAQYLGLPNEERLKNHGVSGCATCDGPIYAGKDVIVVGGGDAAVEEALYLSHICKSVKLIHRRDQLRASTPMKNKLAASTVEVIWNTVVIDVLGENIVTGIRTKNTDGEEKEIECSALFVAIGHKPATDVFRSQLETDRMGYIQRVNGTPETKVPGVFVAGDCADHRFRQAITSAATGCQAALLAEQYLKQ